MKQIIKISIFMTIIGCCLLLPYPSKAQYPVAAPGKDGIFVLFDRKIPSGFSYKLDRKVAASNEDWKTIHSSSNPVLSTKEIYNRLVSVNTKMPFYPVPDSAAIQKFINIAKGKHTTDSIYVFNAFPPYLEVLGTGFFDNDIAPGINYEYRVSKIEKTGKALETKLIKALSFPGKPNNFKATPIEVMPQGNKINIRFKITGDSKPTGFRVYRQVYLQTAFREIHPSTSYMNTPGGITMLMTDTLVVPRAIYNYLVVPFDVLGNDGLVSDTIKVNNVAEYREVPMLRKLEAISLDRELSIKLRWEATNVQNLRGISIYRSLNFDDGYTLYSRVSATDSTFIDRNVQPITNYYYYLVFNGAYGDSPESAKVIGMVKGLKEPVLPPQQVKTESTDAGNVITWRGIENDTKGYYVFRGEGYENPTEQISGLITCDSMNVAFIDSASTLKPGQVYCYAVRSVNKSNLLSNFSETAIAEVLKPQLPTPLNLEVRNFNGAALLIWEDMKAISPYITGYRVLRQEKGKEKVQISTSYNLPINRFVDTSLVRGIPYSYFIQAEGIANSESKPGAPYEFSLSLLEPVPPAGVRATKTNIGIVLYWDLPAVEGLAGFNIYREKLGEKRKLLVTLGLENTNYTDEVTDKGTYFYSISSKTNTKESSPSDEIGIEIE